MALYRNVAGFLQPVENGQVGFTINELLRRGSEVVQEELSAQTNAPTEYTTGGPYIIRDFTQPPVATVNLDPSPATEQNSLPTSVPDPGTTSEPATPAPTPTPGTTIKQNILPLLTLAGLAVVAVAGEPLLRNRKKIVFVAGIGALYYQLAKNQNNG
ncbi:MAG TPA: hypothetical protein VEC93_14095 [Anaerolineae bacterium]|nr:hypothetical protein [Anaerolineae bacterium]